MWHQKKAAQSEWAEQLARVQGPPQSAVRLSCSEIRQLFWKLVKRVEQSAAMVLHWSSWLCWHQAWARYYHYQRHQRRDAERPAPQGAVVQRTVVSSGAEPQANTELIWQRLEPLLPPRVRLRRPYTHARRLILNAIVYRIQLQAVKGR
jgi:hypothetical protein